MLVIDRFEGEYAVIEWDKKMFDFPRELLPSNAKEGDVITMNVLIDHDLTSKRQKEADQMLQDLMKGEGE